MPERITCNRENLKAVLSKVFDNVLKEIESNQMNAFTSVNNELVGKKISYNISNNHKPEAFKFAITVEEI